MKSFNFPAWIALGDNDYGDTIVTVKLNDEEEKRLLAASEVHISMEECKEISDIYNKVYDKAVKQFTEQLRKSDWFEDFIEAISEEEEDDSCSYAEIWQADHMYEIGVEFPEVLQ